MMILRRWPRAVMTTVFMLVVAAFFLWQGIRILGRSANAPILLGWLLVAVGLFKGAVWSFLLVELVRNRDIIDRHVAEGADPEIDAKVRRFETIAFRVAVILGLVLAIGGAAVALTMAHPVFFVVAGYGLVIAVAGILGVRARRSRMGGQKQ